MSVLRTLILSASFIVASASAHAASDVNDSGSLANQAITTATAPEASSITGDLISDAISGGLGGTAGIGTASLPNRQGLTGLSAGDATGNDAKFGIWAKGSYSFLDRSEQALEMEGDLYVGAAGFDYRLTDSLLLGLAATAEHIDIDTTFNSGDFEADGYSLIPYIGWQFSDNWNLSVLAGAGHISYETSRANNTATPVTGDFDATRFFAAANVTGDYEVNSIVIRPKASIISLTEKQDSYTESNQTVVDEQTLDFGRVSAGSIIGRQYGNHLPYVKWRADYDFSTEDSVLKSNGQESFVGDYGGQLGLGYEYVNGAFSLSLQGSYDTLFRDDLDVWTTAGQIRFEF